MVTEMNDKVVSYLSKGFGPPAAEYYASWGRKISSIIPNDDYTLILIFDNGEKRIYDMKPFFKDGTVFNPLLGYKCISSRLSRRK